MNLVKENPELDSKKKKKKTDFIQDYCNEEKRPLCSTGLYSEYSVSKHESTARHPSWGAGQ